MSHYDLLIKGGLVVDGTGMPGIVTDVAIRDGVISRVDGLKSVRAKEVIDAKGLIVAPGFVDLHTHYDAQIFWDPHCTLSGWHGVTSVVIGNCGFGLAPCKPAERERLMLSCPGVSDGGAHMKMFVGGAFTTDFLTWMVRDTAALRLEEAHRALSALPAQMAGLKNRGMILEGQQADIVVYDLAQLGTIPDHLYATAHDLPGGDWRLVKRAKGYRYIIVNGRVTFIDGETTGVTPGRLLRHGRA